MNKTFREELDIDPKTQRKLAKFLAEKLADVMISLDGESKINKQLDYFLSMFYSTNVSNFNINYNIEFSSNNLRLWIKEFKNKKG